MWKMGLWEYYLTVRETALTAIGGTIQQGSLGELCLLELRVHSTAHRAVMKIKCLMHATIQACSLRKYQELIKCKQLLYHVIIDICIILGVSKCSLKVLHQFMLSRPVSSLLCHEWILLVFFPSVIAEKYLIRLSFAFIDCWWSQASFCLFVNRPLGFLNYLFVLLAYFSISFHCFSFFFLQSIK